MTHLAPLPEYRTIWISDLHLGTRGCKAEFLLDFLRCADAETIYLVGLHRRLAPEEVVVLAADAQRRGPEAAAQSPQGHPRRLPPRQSRRMAARLHAAALRRRRGHGRRDPRHRGRPP